MKVLLDRWQFGVTITYHFLFVPLTIGLALLVAVMQVLAYRRRDEVWDQLARFFGTLFLINFAMGVVTGIVQEFQFGMSWSNYSVFVGNIFGAPLAMEGLLAFFAESTFIALWLFGRHRLPPLVHTLSICVVSLGTIVSAFFILTANAWMQHPVGYRIVAGKAELTDFWAVLRNDTLWAEFSHTVLAAFATGAMVVLGVSGWQLLRGRGRGRLPDPGRGQLLAAHHREPVRPARLPDPDPAPAQPDRHPVLERYGRRHNPVQNAEAARYGPGGYVPVLWVTYWSFRLMVGFGFVMLAASAWPPGHGGTGAQSLRLRPRNCPGRRHILIHQREPEPPSSPVAPEPPGNRHHLCPLPSPALGPRPNGHGFSAGIRVRVWRRTLVEVVW
jgi:cytochrome bd ubiquinol oxidase subunit I